MIDRTMIQQATVNILQNANKYSMPETSIYLDLRRENDSIEIEIKNTGSLIKPEDRNKVFDRFYRGNESAIRKKEGAGIGLYISKEIISAHQGNIRIDSNATENSTSFIIEIPIHE